MAEPANPPAPSAPDDDDDVVVAGKKVRPLTEHEQALRTDRRTLRTKLAAEEQKRADAETAIAALTTKHASDLQAAEARGVAAANSRLIAAEVKAEAIKAGAHDPAELLKLLDLGKLTIGDDGEVAGVAELLAAAKASKPWAFSGASVTGQPPGASTSSTAKPPVQAPAGGKKASELTPEEWRAARAALTARR